MEISRLKMPGYGKHKKGQKVLHDPEKVGWRFTKNLRNCANVYHAQQKIWSFRVTTYRYCRDLVVNGKLVMSFAFLQIRARQSGTPRLPLVNPVKYRHAGVYAVIR